MAEVRIKVEGLDKAYESAKHFPGEADKAINATMGLAASKGWGMMYVDTPVITGELRASLFSRQVSIYKMELGATAPHALFVHEGTRPHEIRPVRAKALRFEVGGKIVFAMLVRHPGTRPNPFVRRTALRLVSFIHDNFLARMKMFMDLYKT